MNRLLFWLIIGCFSIWAVTSIAQTDCISKWAGVIVVMTITVELLSMSLLVLEEGYSTYDYGSGSFGDISPRPGGGFDTYDYGTGAFGDVTPRPGGGYNTYDYGTGSFGDVTPRPGGGYNTYDYGTGSFGTIRPRPGGGFSFDEN